jgi:predicted metal-binding membrane protein
VGGAFVMGLRHGLFCVGCCWLLMLVLFVTGVMNLLWVGIITAFVLLEKIVPRKLRIDRVSGTALIAWGLWLVIAAARQ